jgi:hypothetical protein
MAPGLDKALCGMCRKVVKIFSQLIKTAFRPDWSGNTGK